jgi:uncharacterized protein YfaQ (DUF2300 family)
MSSAVVRVGRVHPDLQEEALRVHNEVTLDDARPQWIAAVDGRLRADRPSMPLRPRSVMLLSLAQLIAPY